MEEKGNMKIKLLGIGAILIEVKHNRILIDAFNSYNEPPEIKYKDLILFTHDDGDHFLAEKLPDNIERTSSKVIGPPSIAYPLLSAKKVEANCLRIVYPPHLTQPVRISENYIDITIYQTRHFVDWEPVHISYLLEIEGKKVYITGDSSVLDNYVPEIEKINVLIMSFVDKKFFKKECGQDEALKRHVEEILKVNEKVNPCLVVCNHLLNCSWSVESKSLEEAIKMKNIKNVSFLHSAEEVLVI